MVLDRRWIALAFRLIAIALITTGLVRLVILFGRGAQWAAFTFYTTQSNVVVLVWMIVLAVVTARDMVRDGPRGLVQPWPRLSAMVMMIITVTMLIYVVVLAPMIFKQAGSDYQPFGLTDCLVHIVTPCLAIADWLLFTQPGHLRWYSPLTWAIPPYIYLVWAFTWPLLGGTFGDGNRYPYPFMDIQTNGVAGVAGQLAVLTVALVAFGYLYVGLDRLRQWASRRPPKGTGHAASQVQALS